MIRIQQLPPTVITKIAAGEVIERPASVVKELLENSLDAGSQRIDIDVEQGGIELIRLVDDGHGIHPEDLTLAFASHATSKLRTADDLFRVSTMGFRGEALASIGSVAQVTLQSRQGSDPYGAEISCHGGELSPVKSWNGSPGTRIEVRHLFFNTPVRRKFLRSIPTEIGHICEAVTRVALANPRVHLLLRHNGKLVYEVPASAGLKERIGLFFGAEVRDQLHIIEAGPATARLSGFIADPACERGNNKLQYLFLNSRWIRDRSLGHAVQEAYRGLIMTGRYPVYFLFLDVPPDSVDVNVHPTKCEVRFRDSQALYALILSVIRDKFRRLDLTPRIPVSTTPTFNPTPAPQPMSPMSPMTSSGFTPAPPPPLPPLPAFTREAAPQQPAAAAPAAPAEDFPLLRSQPVNKVIQLHDAYLVLETPEGMLVIDQHALHERILFEQLKQRIRQGSLETQRLLIPEPVDLRPEEAARVLDQQTPLGELGLGVEDFGGGTVLVTSYPAILGDRSPTNLLRAVVEHLTSHDRAPTREVLLNDLLSLMACHAAVKAGDPLKPEEIDSLIAQRHLAQDTHHCPHGRPTALLFSRHDLDRHFRRI